MGNRLEGAHGYLRILTPVRTAETGRRTRPSPSSYVAVDLKGPPKRHWVAAFGEDRGVAPLAVDEDVGKTGVARVTSIRGRKRVLID
jgi:hypothetical protein